MNKELLKVNLAETKIIQPYNVTVKTCLTLEDMELIIQNNIERENYVERDLWIIHNILLIICPELFEEISQKYQDIENFAKVYTREHPDVSEEEVEKIAEQTLGYSSEDEISFEDILYNGLWDSILKACPNIKKGYKYIKKTIDEYNSVSSSLTTLIASGVELLQKVNSGEINLGDLKLDGIMNQVIQLEEE